MDPILFFAKLVFLSGAFYGYYYCFLRNRRFHGYNRVYLLLASLLVIVIPFLRIPLHLSVGGAAAAPLAETLRVIMVDGWEQSAGIAAPGARGHGWLSLFHGWWLFLLYGVGILTGGVLLVRSLVYIWRLRRRSPCRRFSGISLYETDEAEAPFSFFSLIFWRRGIALDSQEGGQIFRHELFHARQRHSADILWMEICCVFFWFNPFFYLMKRELTAIHEFLADEYAVAGYEPMDYAELLLVHSIDRKRAGDRMRSGSGLTSPMFQETIKRRIIMITQFNYARYGYLRRLMILPVLLLLFCAFGLRVVRAPEKGVRPSAVPMTVMVDAGHGGIDPGAMSGDLVEKDLALRLAQTIKSLESAYNVHVLLTRNEDILPGNAPDKIKGLENRVKMTQDGGAAAFVSIHINNNGDDLHPLRTSGFEAYVSLRRQSRGSEQLAAAVLKQLGSIYTTLDTILKRSEEGIYVLDKNSCPAVLLECGFIENPKDVKFFQENQEKIARSILQGIVDYQAAL